MSNVFSSSEGAPLLSTRLWCVDNNSQCHRQDSYFFLMFQIFISFFDLETIGIESLLEIVIHTKFIRV